MHADGNLRRQLKEFSRVAPGQGKIGWVAEHRMDMLREDWFRMQRTDGIVVDDRCRTSDPDIYAVGDCTYHPNDLLGHPVRLESVHNAVEQAKTAAANICGKDQRYAQVPWFWSDQYDLKLQIAGLSQDYDQTIIRGAPAERSFSCLYLNGGRLIAVDAINRPKDFIQSKKLIADHAVIDPALLADSDVELKDMAD